MISGPDLVIACPVCQALAKVFTVENFDPRGAITWSDGWQDAPMMPRPPRITRCANCHKIYWTSEAPQLGYAPAPEIATAEQAVWMNAPFVESLDESGVAEALANGLAPTPDLEMELRVLRWWRGNDAFRRGDAPIGHATEIGAIANIERIIEMMDGGEEDLLLFRAEAQRELGRFEDALRTLEGVCCSDWWPAKSRLLSFIEVRSQRLEILFATDAESPESPTA
jgi:hypothetical protein